MRKHPHFLLGFLPFCTILMSLVKMQISQNGMRGIFVSICFCVATIEVCVFRASASVGALFIF